MAYNPAWSNGNANGRLSAGQHHVRLCDAAELAAAINRRRLLTYWSAWDFSSHLYSLAPVRDSTLDSALWPPFDHLRGAITGSVLYPTPGAKGGQPPTPTSMEWLWPVSDGDEGKRLVSGLTPPGPDEVGLVQKLNGTNHWTDPNLQPAATAIRAVHFNELRQALEWVRRGRWDLPIYWCSGLFTIAPDTPWTAEVVANNGTDELRNVGYAVFRGVESPPLGLVNATALSGSYLEVTADTDCTVEVFHCLRPIDWEWLASWNEYNPHTGAAWASPGGTGPGDSTSVGSVALTAGVPGQISGGNLTAALQNILDGAVQNFLIRRVDVGWVTAAVSSRVVVEFELNAPPN
jgi:hypothetical protein